MKRRAALFALAGALALVVAAGVAFAATVQCQVGVPCVGTDGPDELYGTDRRDDIHAMEGDDLLRGFKGRDLLRGDSNHLPDDPPDGNDRLYGNERGDHLKGYGGSDLLKGGGGDDDIDALDPRVGGNPGEDTVFGGGGADEIDAYDWHFDTIDCGDGLEDRVVSYDAGLDEIKNCEFQNPGS
jgi:Ca2+-binding RTX toxin-like protein